MLHGLSSIKISFYSSSIGNEVDENVGTSTGSICCPCQDYLRWMKHMNCYRCVHHLVSGNRHFLPRSIRYLYLISSYLVLI